MKKLLLSLIPGLAVAILFAACGSNNSGSSTGVAAVTACGVGSGYSTQYGTCLPQGSCPVNYGTYSNQCVPVTMTTGQYGYGSTGYGGSQCTAGYVYTQYGCLTQGGCPMNTGYYNGTCVQGMSTTGYPTGYTGTPYGGGYFPPTYYSNGYYPPYYH
jgi:xanthosine utilization system XapX-like protein